jgi:hypothetical protein
MDRNARDLPDWVVQREVLAKQRRVLLVYGVGHLWRKSPKANFESAGPAASLVSLLEGTHAARASLFHTTAARFPSGPSDRTRPTGPVRSMRMEEQYDALLYLRPRTSWSNAMVSPALCADANVRGNAYKSHGVGRVEERSIRRLLRQGATISEVIRALSAC